MTRLRCLSVATVLLAVTVIAGCGESTTPLIASKSSGLSDAVAEPPTGAAEPGDGAPSATQSSLPTAPESATSTTGRTFAYTSTTSSTVYPSTTFTPNHAYTSTTFTPNHAYTSTTTFPNPAYTSTTTFPNPAYTSTTTFPNPAYTSTTTSPTFLYTSTTSATPAYTTTTLALATGMPDPAAVLRVYLNDVATAADTAGGVMPSYNLGIGSLVYVYLTPMTQTVVIGFEHPSSSNRDVLAEVSDSKVCPGQTDCVAFQTVGVGTAKIWSAGLLPPGCACMAVQYSIKIAVG